MINNNNNNVSDIHLGLTKFKLQLTMLYRGVVLVSVLWPPESKSNM